MNSIRSIWLLIIGLAVCPQISSAKMQEVESSEYGSKWAFTVTALELECINNAVLAHTEAGTYTLNGKAQSRYKNKYPNIREISKPYPGLEHNPKAKMPPPSGLIQRGLSLCQ
jgi:hypothetical protein